MRHDDCGGLAGKAELLTGTEGAPSRPVRKIVLLDGSRSRLALFFRIYGRNTASSAATIRQARIADAVMMSLRRASRFTSLPYPTTLP
jgi:hypothetical protein